MSFSNVQYKEYTQTLEEENIPIIRLDSSFIVSFKKYLSMIHFIEKTGIETSPLQDLIDITLLGRLATRKLRLHKKGIRSYLISPRTIKPLSVNPTRARIGYVSNARYLVNPHTILFTRTGAKIEHVSILSTYLSELVSQIEGEKMPIAITDDLLQGVSKGEIDPYYVAVLFCTEFGKLLIKLSSYGAVEPHINHKILEKLKIARLNSGIETRISDQIREALEKYEAIAWKSYFKVKRIVEENLPIPNEKKLLFASNMSFSRFTATSRLDPKFMMIEKAIEELTKTKGADIVRVRDWFRVRKGTAPSNRKYRNKKGDPYITSVAIDKSGILDAEFFYYLPQEEQTKTAPKARKGSILVTTDAHDIRGIGKVGIVHPHNDLMLMSGLAMLEPREDTDADPYYAFAILKSKLLNKMIRSSTYGLTAHLTKESIERLPIPIVESIQQDISKLTKSFLDNLHQARKLKRQAISILESRMSEVLKDFCKD